MCGSAAGFPMIAVRAALAYFAIVFAFGFVLGVPRVLLIEPRIGAAWAVSIEVPVMLAVSWLAARWLVPRYAVTTAASRLQMGLLALLLLIVAETLLGFAFGQTLSGQLGAYLSARGAWTLLGQLGFAAMPLLVSSPAPTEPLR